MTLDPLVLVVEDDPAIRRVLRGLLSDAGCQVEFAQTMEGARSLTASLKPDLIVLDLGLPDGDGQDFVAEVCSATPTPPVLVVSARGSEEEKVRALDAGALDYVTKPFGPAELKARVRAILRHSRPSTQAGPLQFDDLIIDPQARRVFRGGTELHLTPLEYKLLLVMAQNAGKILTSSYLLREVWGHENQDQRHYVRVLTAGLRRKLEPEPGHSRFIHTETGVGYRFYS